MRHHIRGMGGAVSYLGVELLQERLLHSRHHAVQMGLQRVKLLCQEHPAQHKQS